MGHGAPNRIMIHASLGAILRYRSVDSAHQLIVLEANSNKQVIFDIAFRGVAQARIGHSSGSRCKRHESNRFFGTRPLLRTHGRARPDHVTGAATATGTAPGGEVEEVPTKTLTTANLQMLAGRTGGLAGRKRASERRESGYKVGIRMVRVNGTDQRYNYM